MKKLILILIILLVEENFTQDSLFIYPSARDIEISVDANVIKSDSHFIYTFEVVSGANSFQNIFQFFVEFNSELHSIQSPVYWRGSSSSRWLNILMWSSRDSLYDILPGTSLSGYSYLSNGLPSIQSFYGRGFFEIPSFEEGEAPDDSEVEGGGILENSVKGYTIGPKEIDTPFIPLNFLDTLLNYTRRSLELGWITNQPTADKYDTLFNTAKTLLEGNHIPWVDSTLHTVLQEVDEDSSGNITSEAYALLRYNTEYLLENLPEVIPPVLTSISPSLALPYDGGVEFLPLTVTLIGNYFSDSSIVYFDDQPYVANFISDSILTFHITNESYLKNTGDYPVWVSNYEVNSNTLYFSVVNNFPEELTPVVECVQDNQNGTYTAFFGYNNDNETTVFIHIGQQNNVYDDLSELHGEAPVIFLPGRHENVFTKEFHTGRSINWLLNNESVQANEGSTACP